MKTVDVFGKYKVLIGKNLLNNVSEIIETNKFSNIFVIKDEKVPDNFLSEYKSISIPSGEANKNIETVQGIWKELLELNADRKSLVINLGGGVIGDMGGFAASTYMRGINFIQAPTTVLSAVDASVGGKVGIDFANIKNLIGAFNQPLAVVVDISTFTTLPKREFISGFGEIIKHGIIADAEYFDRVTSKLPNNFSEDELIEIITRSCEIKAKIIFSDEKESGNRKLLNFGHTIGHALESLSLETNNPLLHGEAVALGMVAEAKISELKNLLSKSDFSIVESSLKNSGLPTSYQIKNFDKVRNLISKDKKSEAGKVSWTLIKGIGEAVINQDVSTEDLDIALKYISNHEKI